jgi:hypothetical protein
MVLDSLLTRVQLGIRLETTSLREYIESEDWGAAGVF